MVEQDLWIRGREGHPDPEIRGGSQTFSPLNLTFIYKNNENNEVWARHLLLLGFSFFLAVSLSFFGTRLFWKEYKCIKVL